MAPFAVLAWLRPGFFLLPSVSILAEKQKVTWPDLGWNGRRGSPVPLLWHLVERDRAMEEVDSREGSGRQDRLTETG